MLRVRVHSEAVDRLLRLEAEERKLGERLHRDTVRRTTLQRQIRVQRSALKSQEAQEYERWEQFRAEDQRAAMPSRCRRSTAKDPRP